MEVGGVWDRGWEWMEVYKVIKVMNKADAEPVFTP